MRIAENQEVWHELGEINICVMQCGTDGDGLRRIAGRGWMRTAENWDVWYQLGDAYFHQWTAIA